MRSPPPTFAVGPVQEVHRFGVRVIVVEPGFFATDLLHSASKNGTVTMCVCVRARVCARARVRACVLACACARVCKYDRLAAQREPERSCV